MIKLGQLSHRNLETKVQFEIEQEDGSYKKEDFRIVTRDMPQAEFQKLLDDVKAETDARFTAYDEAKTNFEEAKKRGEVIEFTIQPPPTEQHLFHSRIVVKLPDLIDDDGTVPEPTVETFARLGQNANLVINEAIWRRRTEIDPKK
jgi:hypothetical protein